MKETKISENSTFYNYTLVKKINYPPVLKTIYLSFITLLAVFDLYHLQENGLITFIICFVGVYFLHYVLLRVSLQLTQDPSLGTWGQHWRIPCFGYLPNGYASLQVLYRFHLQLLLIGTTLITFFYVWLSLAFIINLLYFHLWLVLPRFFILKKFMFLKKYGFVKFNKQDASFYIP
mgnify:CR=1 FL=1